MCDLYHYFGYFDADLLLLLVLLEILIKEDIVVNCTFWAELNEDLCRYVCVEKGKRYCYCNLVLLCSCGCVSVVNLVCSNLFLMCEEY